MRNQIHKESAKRCPCTTLRLPGAVPVGCQLFQHPLCNSTAHDMKGEDHWERAGTKQLLELGKGQLEGEAAPGWCRALAVTPGIESQPCGSILGSGMRQRQPGLAAEQGDPCRDGNLPPHPCQAMPGDLSAEGCSSFQVPPSGVPARIVLGLPGLEFFPAGAGLGMCGGCCWCNQELPV